MASYLEETRVLANQGDAKAQYSLGSIYDEGDGVPEDNARAIMWYTKAANQGDEDAQYNLTLIGDEQDETKAVGWHTELLKPLSGIQSLLSKVIQLINPIQV